MDKPSDTTRRVAHGYSLQIGNPNRISAECKLVVVSDFRGLDVALGGEGAPLVPAFHKAIFHSPQQNRVILNIGGIANITLLPGNPNQSILGFDCGPGNTLMDHVCRQHFNQPYDQDGKLAAKGKVDTALLKEVINNEPYFLKPFPKSTGPDYFSPNWLDNSGLNRLSAHDLMATLSHLTASSITSAISSCTDSVDQVYVCGGGSHNDFLIQLIQQKLAGTPVSTTADIGLAPDWVEAVAFAWLAKRRLETLPGNLPEVTKASSEAILGCIYQG